MPARSKPLQDCGGAAFLLVVFTLTTGCIGPLSRVEHGCGEAVSSDCGETCTCEEDECCHSLSHSLKDGACRCGGACCHGPCKVCGHVMNCCTANGIVGPPEIPPPGRFHPVPTHPVFAGGPAPAVYVGGP